MQINPFGETKILLIFEAYFKCKDVPNKVSSDEYLIRELYIEQHIKNGKLRRENVFNPPKKGNVSLNRYRTDLLSIKSRCENFRSETFYGVGIFKESDIKAAFNEAIEKCKSTKFQGNILKEKEQDDFDKDLTQFADAKLRNSLFYAIIVKKLVDNCLHAEIVIKKNKYTRSNPLFGTFIRICADKLKVIESSKIVDNDFENLI